MARAPDEREIKAIELYKNGTKLVEIASQLNVPEGTIRRWKSTHKWDGERSGKKGERSGKKSKQFDDGTKATMENEELTPEQRLFCIYYSKSFNAGQSYQKSYKCTYASAMAAGSRLLRNVNVIEELQRLNEIKRQQIVINEADMVEFHMRIAFADMGDYVSFGQKEIPLIVEGKQQYDEDGNKRTIKYNTVSLNESENVDTQLIKEVKEGKDGISVKLLDRCKSLEWLDKYFTMNPMDKHKLDYENKKLKSELEERKARIKLLQKQTIGNDVGDEDTGVVILPPVLPDTEEGIIEGGGENG